MVKSNSRFAKYLLFLCCLMALMLPGREAACLTTPTDYMQCAVEEIMAILHDDQLRLPEKSGDRRKLILTVVRHHFDFHEMSKLTLGAEWKEITDYEQKHFVDVFSQLIENTYINKIEAYSDEKIVFQKESVKDNKSVVPTIIRHNDLDIPIHYRLYKTETGKWLVYDVVIEGVSLVQNYRSQFTSIIRKEKYAGLVQRIDEKLSKVAAQDN
jgi:phospholipid transport system substrate-binding protein